LYDGDNVVPEIKLKAQRIMSGIRNLMNVLEGAFSSVDYIRVNPQMKLITEHDRGRVSSSESINKIKRYGGKLTKLLNKMRYQ
jgi:hypothetical protein